MYLPDGRHDLENALSTATARRPLLAATLQQITDRLREPGTEFSTRFQQTSGMVMAKGVEDNAFYRWTRLTSLTEVGAEPADFSIAPTEFHATQALRWASMPDSMTTLSTHDTKRGEDVRARISAISEIPEQWAEAVRHWNRAAPLRDAPLANLLWQAIVGAWPLDRDRVHAYAEKAAREAGNSTRWIDPDTAFEKSMHALVDAAFDDSELSDSIASMAEVLTRPGWSNSLSAKVVQLLGPGVPDVYQGTELWANSLVDPDNRRPVDHGIAADMLTRLDDSWQPEVDDSGAAKLLVVSRALRLRRDRPELFTGYLPLSATGPAAAHLVAFDRGGVLALATRLPIGLADRGGWADTDVTLPAGTWRDALYGSDLPASTGTVSVTSILKDYPVAILVRES
jgi:(1->4)-alpha-D-glucan 1-alpha-D-glucosylmutase